MLSDITSKKLEGIQKCAKSERKVQNLFKIMTNCLDLWKQAYANIYDNKGAVSKGCSEITMDGFSEDRVLNLIKLLKEQRYFPTPSKRVYIPKANGRKRPLGLPSGNEKLVQEVVRILLENIYEPIFSDRSHGFRPNKSCHTALSEIGAWNGAIWLVEFDIRGCFDEIDHQIMISILGNKIDDWKFLKVIKKMLRAGYMEDWKYHRTYSGTPQGGVCSPILANIYLHELDKFVDDLAFSKGRRRSTNIEYRKLNDQVCYIRKKINRLKSDSKPIDGLLQKLKEKDKIRRSLPSTNMYDPGYKRLWYCRYADDFIMGIIGSKHEAIEIRKKVESFLKDKLNLYTSNDKTRVIHAGTEKSLFLGYNIGIESSEKLKKIRFNGGYTLKRTQKKVLKLKVPREMSRNFCKRNGYGHWETSKPMHRATLQNLSDAEIISTYNAELRGIANYYALADDVKSKLNKLFYMATYSLIKTLACKHKTTANAICSKLSKGTELVYKYKHKEMTKERKVFKLTHLQRKPKYNKQIDHKPNIFIYQNGTELLKRINARECDICSKQEGYFEVHHVRKLSDIKDGKKKWEKLMIARRRKTLILCVECHQLLHAGNLPDWRFMNDKVESVVH